MHIRQLSTWVLMNISASLMHLSPASLVLLVAMF